MKRTHFPLLTVLLASAFLWTGCKAKETTSGNSANSSPPVAAAGNTSTNSNQPASKDSSSSASSGAQAPAAVKPNQPPTLIGTYEWREVEADGVVTIISAVKTTISFTADGGYARVSQRAGQTYHNDAGKFTIEPPDKLTFSIEIAEKTIKSPPVTKTLKFTLSPDGDTLKLTDEKKGKVEVAVYQRIVKPKST